MAEWSTDAVHPRERYAYWREAICKWVFNTSIEAPPGPFSARLASRASGPLRVVAGESSAYMLVRNRRELDAAPSDEYCIYLQRRSEGTIEQGGQSCTYRANDLGLSDLRLPFRTSHADGGRRIVAVVPRELIDRRAPWVATTPLRKFAADSLYADLARRHMVAMAEKKMSESAMALLTENLCNLIALASAEDIAPNRMPAELQIEAMLAFCRQRLHDPELSPQHVADHLGVSVRTLHSRFKQLGDTFGRWVAEERLNACSVALRDPGHQGLKISDIAYRWGFNDLSHFNKAFRARFGCTPTEWRNGPAGDKDRA